MSMKYLNKAMVITRGCLLPMAVVALPAVLLSLVLATHSTASELDGVGLDALATPASFETTALMDTDLQVGIGEAQRTGVAPPDSGLLLAYWPGPEAVTMSGYAELAGRVSADGLLEAWQAPASQAGNAVPVSLYPAASTTAGAVTAQSGLPGAAAAAASDATSFSLVSLLLGILTLGVFTLAAVNSRKRWRVSSVPSVAPFLIDELGDDAKQSVLRAA